MSQRVGKHQELVRDRRVVGAGGELEGVKELSSRVIRRKDGLGANLLQSLSLRVVLAAVGDLAKQDGDVGVLPRDLLLKLRNLQAKTLHLGRVLVAPDGRGTSLALAALDAGRHQPS